MKKIIFILICFLWSSNIIFAHELVSENTKYYVKIKSGSNPYDIINIKKVYDKDTKNVVFNINYKNYEVGSDFNKYDEFNNKTWSKGKGNYTMFKNIAYYGYNSNPSDFNYFLTQVFVWKWASNYEVLITDKDGNEITDYEKEYNILYNKINNHNLNSSFFVYTHNTEIWTNNKFTYSPNAVILDNPVVEGLKISTNNKDINIYNDKIGDYKIDFYKEYDNEDYCYSDGTNIYWQNLKGPTDILKTLKYNVYGTKINIKENYNGINNRFGDAVLDSDYELYLDDELKLIITNLEDIYVKSNSSYKLIDISSTNGFNNLGIINFNISNNEYTLELDKYVISKNISFNIQDNKTYYIYLKSNNELYEKINNNTDLITLPYGTYYIKDDENTYYHELIIDNNIDEEISIDNEIEKIEIVENKTPVEEEVIFEPNVIKEVENPKTLDDINSYIIYLIFSIIVLILTQELIRREFN